MKTVVLSLGGSIIVPDHVDIKLLEKFRQELRKHYSKYKFVIVCGGGSIARKYIEALRQDKAPEHEQALAGIRATRMNAMLLMEIFGHKEANDVLPKDMKDIEGALRRNNVVICGALRFTPHSTSDGTAARIAHHLKTDFINITNIKGLFDSNPAENKNAKFIPLESWKDFEARALKIKYSSGQHFVLDQEAAIIIREHKIKTYIIGKDLKNFTHLLNDKKFVGTTIAG
jgi:uridylate kinase